VWALENFGFRVIVAPSFADIFANNCVQNGVLTVVLPEEQVAEIQTRAHQTPHYELTVDLERLAVTDNLGFSTSFQIEESTRRRLLHGLDDIGLTLQHEPEIAAYEAAHPTPAKIAQSI
jgi:3-isopropylmalate/(R)-2-methylmalate dehydratase small subunit